VPGAPLGALRGSRARRDYPEVAVRLGPGDALVQYTDGIHEALGGDGRSFFGLERMAEAAEAAAAGGLEAVLEALSRAVDAWRQGAAQHDDETLLVVSRRADAHADGAAGQSSEAEGLARLAEARARGRRLTLPASPQALVRLEDWLRTLPELAGLDRRAAGLLRLALHEACGNVVEHACRRDAARTYDLWWLPAAGEGAALGRGEFVLRDRGVSFRYQDHEPPRWEDRAVRRRGRGFGLEIVRRVMRSVAYHPGTPEGNIAFLAFDPGRPAGAEEGHGQDG
jgi:anti-sigma regulatory factor (Ser/Thr protein kinase)